MPSCGCTPYVLFVATKVVPPPRLANEVTEATNEGRREQSTNTKIDSMAQLYGTKAATTDWGSGNIGARVPAVLCMASLEEAHLSSVSKAFIPISSSTPARSRLFVSLI